jgi:hypothetical protein
VGEIVRSTRRSLFLLVLHREHIKDLSYHTIKRAMFFAEDLTRSVEPHTRFFKLRDAWM